jgi:hypothetical protein
MSRCLAILSGCLLAFPLANADPPPKAPEKPLSFLPDTVGDTLVIEETRPTADGETTRLITRTVVAAKRTDGASVVAIKEEKERAPPNVEMYQQSDSGLFLMSRDLQLFDPPCCVARLPLKAGDTWEVNDPDAFPTPIRFRVGKEEEIEVPAGKFKAVRIEKETILRDLKRVRVTEWTVPGMGAVKVRARLGDGTEIVHVLKSFTRAKK